MSSLKVVADGRGGMARSVIMCLGSLAGLLACGQPSGPIPTVPPAGPEERVEYSRSITDRADRRRDASLYEYFCLNALDAPCPEDIDAQLAGVTVQGDRSRLGVADGFVRLLAARRSGDADGPITDQAYLDAAYQVALGRAPDPAGAADNLAFIQNAGERELMLRSLLQSNEFRSRP